MKKHPVSVLMGLMIFASSIAQAGTCVDQGALGRFFSVNPFYNVRYDRYVKLIHQAEASKGPLFEHAVKKIKRSCPSKTSDQIRDLLIMGDMDGTFCPDTDSTSEIPFFKPTDVIGVRKTIQAVRDDCREPSFFEQVDFDE